MASDQRTLAVSNEVVKPEYESFPSRDYFQIQDQQGGSYNGIIQFDTSSVSLTDYWIDPLQSFFEIPYQVSGTANGAYDPTLGFALKNGFPLIDSAIVQIDAKTISNLDVMGLPLWNALKTLQTWSTSHYSNAGALLMQYPDTVDAACITLTAGAGSTVANTYANNFAAQTIPNMMSNGSAIFTAAPVATTGADITMQIVTAGAAGAAGTGLLNFSLPAAGNAARNIPTLSVTPVVNTSVTGVGTSNLIPRWNEGLFYRLKWSMYPYTWGAITNPAQTQMATVGGLNRYVGVQVPDTATRILQTWNVIVPLVTVSDFFAKCGLLKNRLTFQLNYNGVTSSAATANSPFAVTGGVTQLNQQINPLIASSTALLPSGVGSIQALTCGILTPGPCYLYLRKVRLTAEMEMAMPAERMIVYRDIHRYQYNTTAGNPQITWNITNGVSRMRRIHFFLFPAAGGMLSASQPYRQWCNSEPAHSTPGYYFTNNTQLQIGGKVAYQFPFRYQWEEWVQGPKMQFYGQSEDPVLSGGHKWDYYTWLTAGIHTFDLTACGLDAQGDLDGGQVTLLTTLIAPNSCLSEIHCLIEYDKIVKLALGAQAELVAY